MSFDPSTHIWLSPTKQSPAEFGHSECLFVKHKGVVELVDGTQHEVIAYIQESRNQPLYVLQTTNDDEGTATVKLIDADYKVHHCVVFRLWNRV